MIETVGAVLVRSGRVLLGLRAAHKSFAGCWDLIGGHIEIGETPWTALCRELQEEIGVEDVAGNYQGTLALVNPGRHQSLLHVYAVTTWRGEPLVRNDEHTALRWFGLAEAAGLSSLATPQYLQIFALLRGREPKPNDDVSPAESG